LQSRRNNQEEIWVTWEEYQAQEEEIKRLREEIEKYKPPVEEIQRKIAEVKDRIRRVSAERSFVEKNLKSMLSRIEARGQKPVTLEEYNAEKSEYYRMLANYRWVKSYWGKYAAKARDELEEIERLNIFLKHGRYSTDKEKEELERELKKHMEEYRKWSELASLNAREMRRLEKELPQAWAELKRKIILPDKEYYERRLEELRRTEEQLKSQMEELQAELKAAKKEKPPKELIEKLRKLEEEHKKKKIYRKLVALHKRWQYESSKGKRGKKGHDLMIEGIATVIIEGWEDEWEYKRKMNKAIWDEVDKRFRGDYGEIGWEELKRIFSGQEETVGFQVKYTKLPPRDIVIEEIDWVHTIEKESIGYDEKGKPKYKKVPILSLKEATAKYPFVKIARIEGEET